MADSANESPKESPKETPKLAIAAVVVSAVVGVLAMVGSIVSVKLNTDAAQRDLRERLSEDRAREDIAELRGVLDTAAANLGRVQPMARSLNDSWLEGDKDAQQIQDEDEKLVRQNNLCLEIYQRMRVRLGQSAPAAKHYLATTEHVDNVHVNADGPRTRANKKLVLQALDGLYRERDAFFDAARDVVGSRVGDPPR